MQCPCALLYTLLEDIKSSSSIIAGPNLSSQFDFITVQCEGRVQDTVRSPSCHVETVRVPVGAEESRPAVSCLLSL